MSNQKKKIEHKQPKQVQIENFPSHSAKKNFSIDAFSENKQLVIASFIFLGLTLIFFFKQIVGTGFFWNNYWVDFAEQHLPFMKINLEAFQNGEVPAWNPYVFSGTIHVADPATQFYYPFHFLIYLFASNVDELIDALNWMIIFHFFLAQVGMFYLTKSFKSSFWASILAAVGYGFSCSMVCRWQMLPVLYAIALAPLALSFFIRFINSNKFIHIVFASIVLSFIFLAGQPQFYFYTLIVIGIWSLFLLYERFQQSKDVKKIIITSLLLFIPIILSIGISAIQILHTIEFLPFSYRSDITLDFATDGSLAWEQIKTVFTPWLFGYYKGGLPLEFTDYFLTPNKPYHYWETAYYFGAIVFFLSIVSFLDKKSIFLKIACTLTISFAFLHAFGSNSMFFKMLFNLPGFDSFRIPSRILFIGTISFCVLAAIGFDNLFSLKLSKKNFIIVGIIFFITVLLLQNSISGTITKYSLNDFLATSLNEYKLKFMVSIIVVLLGVVAYYFNLLNTTVLGVVFTLALFYDLYSYNSGYKNSDINFKDQLKLDDNYVKTLSQNSFTNRYSPNDLRYRLFKRNQSVLYKIKSTDGFYAVKHQVNGIPNIPYNKLMSVSNISIPIRNNEYGGIDYTIQVDTSVYTHQRMVYKTNKYDSVNFNPNVFDYLNVALLENKLPVQLVEKNTSEIKHNVSFVNETYSSQEYNVETEEEGILVIAENYYPVWTATIDDKPTQVFPVYRSLRGIVVPKGKHKIKFSYDSPAYKKGKLISIFSICITLILLLFSLYKSIHLNRNAKITPVVNE